MTIIDIVRDKIIELDEELECIQKGARQEFDKDIISKVRYLLLQAIQQTNSMESDRNKIIKDWEKLQEN